MAMPTNRNERRPQRGFRPGKAVYAIAIGSAFLLLLAYLWPFGG